MHNLTPVDPQLYQQDGLTCLSAPAWLDHAIHDLCQPLTALQCRIFLGTLSSAEEDSPGMADALRESLVQCDRVIEQVRVLQQKLRTEVAR
jgi:hypothetical protein